MYVWVFVCVHVSLTRLVDWPISENSAALLQITMTPNFLVIAHWSFTLVPHTQTIHPATFTLNAGWLKQQTYISYNSGDSKIQDQAACKFSV